MTNDERMRLPRRFAPRNDNLAQGGVWVENGEKLWLCSEILHSVSFLNMCITITPLYFC